MTDEEEFAARSQLKWTREGDAWTLVVQPWLRFHIPLIEPDKQISRIRLSDKTSRFAFACNAICSF